MDTTCKLCSKCLKTDESLEKCEDPECDNTIHSSCGRKLVANTKCNAESLLSLKNANSILSKLESLSLL